MTISPQIPTQFVRLAHAASGVPGAAAVLPLVADALVGIVGGAITLGGVLRVKRMRGGS